MTRGSHWRLVHVRPADATAAAAADLGAWRTLALQQLRKGPKWLSASGTVLPPWRSAATVTAAAAALYASAAAVRQAAAASSSGGAGREAATHGSTVAAQRPQGGGAAAAGGRGGGGGACGNATTRQAGAAAIASAGGSSTIGPASSASRSRGAGTDGSIGVGAAASAAAQEAQEVPVVVVGAGPTGLTLSLLLTKYGVRHIVVERALGPTQHPQAHFVNNRTMEVFRGLGLSGPVRRRMPPLEQWRKFVYCERVAGRLYGEVDHFPGQSSPLSPAVSPEPVAHLPQHTLLRLMLARQGVAAAAAGMETAAAAAAAGLGPAALLRSLVSVPFASAAGTADGAGWAVNWGTAVRAVRVLTPPAAATEGAAEGAAPVVEVDVESTSATAAAASVAASPSSSAAAAGDAGDTRGGGGAGGSAAVPAVQRVRKLRCRYLVAADGAHSTVRGLVGGRMEGSGPLQHLLNAHFRSAALGRSAAARPAMLYFVFNPDVVAVLVAHDIDSGEFVAQIPYFPPLQSPADFPPERVVQLIRAAAGTLPGGGEVDVQLLQLRPWVMSAEVADRYAFGAAGSGGGSPPPAPAVFLAGDAAHRFPPAGGFGMNTGVQDAAGLAWRLAAVLRGLAAPGLLGSYESERRPVAQAASALSVRNWGEATRVPAALGLDPRVANAVSDAVAGAAPLPQWARKSLLEGVLGLGRRLAGPDGLPLLPGLGAWRTQQVQRILSSGASLRLQYPAEDLGYVYDRGAVVARHPTVAAAAACRGGGGATSTAEAEGASPPPPPEARLPPRGAPYHPSSAPGCRLPHCWLALHAPLPPPPSSPQQRQQTLAEAQEQQHRGQQQGQQQPQPPLVLLSTLDVVADPWIGPRLLLLADGYRGCGGANPWLAAAAAICRRSGEGRGSSEGAHGVTGERRVGAGTGGRAPLAVVQVLQRTSAAGAGGAVAAAAAGTRSQHGMPASQSAPPADAVHEPPVGSALGPAAAAVATAAAAASATDAAAAAAAVTVEEAEPGGWARTMGLPPGSCLLVRPDGHVAWRHMGPPGAPRSSSSVEAAPGATAAGAAAGDGGVETGAAEEAEAAEALLRAVLRELHWRLPGGAGP